MKGNSSVYMRLINDYVVLLMEGTQLNLGRVSVTGFRSSSCNHTIILLLWTQSCCLSDEWQCLGSIHLYLMYWWLKELSKSICTTSFIISPSLLSIMCPDVVSVYNCESLGLHAGCVLLPHLMARHLVFKFSQAKHLSICLQMWSTLIHLSMRLVPSLCFHR